MKQPVCICAAVLLNLGCAAPSDNQPSRSVEDSHPTSSSSYIQPSLDANRNVVADVSRTHSTTTIHGVESDVKCESTDYNQLEYKDGVEMLKMFFEKNCAMSGSVHAAVLHTTAVYICAGEDSNDVCETMEWNIAEQLIDQRCGTGRMGAARVNNKIYGRGSPGNYKC